VIPVCGVRRPPATLPSSDNKGFRGGGVDGGESVEFGSIARRRGGALHAVLNLNLVGDFLASRAG